MCHEWEARDAEDPYPLVSDYFALCLIVTFSIFTIFILNTAHAPTHMHPSFWYSKIANSVDRNAISLLTHHWKDFEQLYLKFCNKAHSTPIGMNMVYL